MAQLYPQAPGSIFVAFYDSQGYGGGILTCLHTGFGEEIGERIRKDIHSLTQKPAKFWSRDETSNVMTENVTTCCLVKAIAHLGRR
jgi:hypothetical protein